MSEIIARPYTPIGSWLARTLDAFALALENIRIRSAERHSESDWFEDIDRLLAKEDRK